jgi:hypothetical protein
MPKARSDSGAIPKVLSDPKKCQSDAHLATKKNNSTNFGEKPFFLALGTQKIAEKAGFRP